jgi:ppGpp synthetase/RelA/SpoT-type nucleotidyltranferase
VTAPWPLTKSQVDKLGDRLKAEADPSDDDLELLARYQESLLPVLEEAKADVSRVFHAVPGTAPFEPTSRVKQLVSTRRKLRREGTRLSSMQDLQGCRIVVRGAAEQEALVAEWATASSTDDRWTLVDRRKDPRYGYRAVHLIRKGSMGSVEVQIRTQLQHQWAELSEQHERIVPGAKYGRGDPLAQEVLQQLSGLITELEDLELQTAPGQEQELERIRRQMLDFLQQTLQSLEEETRE